MTHPVLLHDLIRIAAARAADAIALEAGAAALSYARLAQDTGQFANGVLALGLARADRVAVYLEKRFEAVTAMFGASAAGGVAVPINPALKPAQVEHILRDCVIELQNGRGATMRVELNGAGLASLAGVCSGFLSAP